MKYLYIIIILFLVSCQQDKYKDFSELYPAQRFEVIKKMNLKDQIGAYLYTLEHRHPAPIDLAIPIAQQGGESFNYINNIIDKKNDREKALLLIVIDEMNQMKTFKPCQNGQKRLSSTIASYCSRWR